MAAAGLKAVYQWVVRTMMKMKGETGIVQTMPKKDIVEMNTQITAQRLMQNGIDPTQLKNADQVENAIIAIENRPKVQQGIRNTKSADVFDLKGKKIKDTKNIMGGEELPPGDPDLPPPGSRGGPDDIAAPVQSAEETIKNMIEAENKKGIANIQKRILEEDREIENLYGSAGFGKDQKVDAEFLAEYLAENAGKVYDDLPTKERLNFYDRAFNALTRYKRTKGTSVIDEPKKLDSRTKEKMDDMKDIEDPEDMAQGGRAGFKEGMTRRTFLKLLGGMAAVPIVGKFFKLAKVGKTMKEVPMIKTDDVAGKPEWFDALVNKVIVEGDDVTKKFATGERQSIHQKTLDDGSVVRVTEDVDDGAVRVEYESKESMFGEPVQMQYKKPKPDEGDPRPAAEFEVSESGMVGRADGPDDFVIEPEEVGGSSIRDLDSDVSKLKQYATGKGPTMKEIVEIKKRKDKVKKLSEGDPDATSQYITDRQGDYDPSPDDFASGGIARLLGE